MSIFDFKKLNFHACQLQEEQIDLWFLSLKASSTPFESILSPDELERGRRFYFKKHQRRFYNARGLLRSILARYLNCPAETIQFQYNEHGKPSVLHTQDIEFNVSHSGEWALIGIGKKHPLGVDIETYSSRPYEGIASHVFSPLEQRMIQNASTVLKPWLFFNIWAQKEAFIKACGLGLFYPTQTFTVDFSQKEDLEIYDEKHQCLWKMKHFMPQVALAAALCHHPDVNQITYLAVDDAQELLKP